MPRSAARASPKPRRSASRIPSGTSGRCCWSSASRARRHGEEIREHLSRHVAKWWLPDEILFVESLPHTATGKLLKTALREQVNQFGSLSLAAAQRLDDVHHLAGAVGIMLVEPGAEQRRDFVRQAHRDVEDAARARLRRGFDDRLQLVVGDARHHRRDGDVVGMPASLSAFTAASRLRPPARAAPACGEISGVSEVTEIATRPALLRGHRREDVDVAQHPVRLGGDADRVPRLGSTSTSERMIRHLPSIGW
jgi:hypothetical protein